MEIQNQNHVNTEEQRLNELKQEKKENIQILHDIQHERAALAQEKDAFKTYKQAAEDEIMNKRVLLQRESENLENNRKTLGQ